MRPPLWTDTSPEAERFLIEGYRRMSLQQKALRLTSLVQAGHELALTRLRALWPEESEDALMVRVAALFLEPELLEAALRRRAAVQQARAGA